MFYKTIFNGSRSTLSLINEGKNILSRFSQEANVKRIDSVFKLIYNLFIYSILGIFAKVAIKLFKL